MSSYIHVYYIPRIQQINTRLTLFRSIYIRESDDTPRCKIVFNRSFYKYYYSSCNLYFLILTLTFVYRLSSFFSFSRLSLLMVRGYYKLLALLRAGRDIPRSDNWPDSGRDQALCETEQGRSRNPLLEPREGLVGRLHPESGCSTSIPTQRHRFSASRAAVGPRYSPGAISRQGCFSTRFVKQYSGDSFLPKVNCFWDMNMNIRVFCYEL